MLVGSLNPHSPWGLWHRHRLHRPLWSAARFLTRAELERLGRRHGRTRWRAGLMLPRSLPAMRHWAPATERTGARVAGRWAAFGVLTITLHARDD